MPLPYQVYSVARIHRRASALQQVGWQQQPLANLIIRRIGFQATCGLCMAKAMIELLRSATQSTHAFQAEFGVPVSTGYGSNKVVGLTVWMPDTCPFSTAMTSRSSPPAGAASEYPARTARSGRSFRQWPSAHSHVPAGHGFHQAIQAAGTAGARCLPPVVPAASGAKTARAL